MADDVVIRAEGLGKTQPRLEHINMLRGCAALLVMAGHLRSYVFANLGSLDHPNLAIKLFYGITGLGHQAVVIFFAMSGYLVGGKVVQQMISGHWSWSSYLLRRLTRLWIVIVPALAATFVIDHVGMALGGVGYDGSLYPIYVSGPNAQHPLSYGIGTFLGNLAFVQTIWVPIFGSNAPMWSLANEFWYYLVFPLAASLALLPYRAAQRLLAVLLLVAALWFLPGWLLQAGAIWIAGAAAAWLGKQSWAATALQWTSVRLLATALAVTALTLAKASTRVGDLPMGIAIAVWLPVIAMVPRCGRFYSSCASGGAEISYTLYLTHFPLLSLVIMVGLAPHRFLPSPSGALIYFGLFISAIAWATAFWWCFERHTNGYFTT
jgi:peptidoglycan/LPS O-acetylase OafA/YrhL